MKTQSPNKNSPEISIDARMRTMRILWIAMLLAIGNFYVFSILSGRSESVVPNQTISLTLLIVAMMAALVSFLVKSKLLSRAIEQQQTGMVQQAYVVAWAITEVGAILSLLDFFMTGNRYYFVALIIAGCAQLLHFPRREHVINAAFKNTF